MTMAEEIYEPVVPLDWMKHHAESRSLSLV